MQTCEYIYTQGPTATRARNSPSSSGALETMHGALSSLSYPVSSRPLLSVLITTEILAIPTDWPNQRTWLGHVTYVAEHKSAGEGKTTRRYV